MPAKAVFAVAGGALSDAGSSRKERLMDTLGFIAWLAGFAASLCTLAATARHAAIRIRQRRRRKKMEQKKGARKV